MGMVYEHTMPIIFGVGDVPIRIETPCDLFDKAGILVHDPEATPTENLIELSNFLNKACIYYPEIFDNRRKRVILSVHIAYKDNEVEKEMLEILKQGCDEDTRKSIKSIVDRVDPLIFLDEEIINLLKD